MTKLLNVSKLEEGMILQEDIIHKETGVVLVRKDTVITEKHIIKLFRHEIPTIKIKEKTTIYNYNEELMVSYSKVEEKLTVE